MNYLYFVFVKHIFSMYFAIFSIKTLLDNIEEKATMTNKLYIYKNLVFPIEALKKTNETEKKYE